MLSIFLCPIFSLPSAFASNYIRATVDAGTKHLILGKSSRLEIFELTAEGLVPVIDTDIYGRIAALEVIRYPVRACALYLVTWFCLFTCTPACLPACMSIYVCTCLHGYICVYTCAYLCLCVSVRLSLSLFLSERVCVSVSFSLPVRLSPLPSQSLLLHTAVPLYVPCQNTQQKEKDPFIL